jgi:hypothetical protein
MSIIVALDNTNLTLLDRLGATITPLPRINFFDRRRKESIPYELR